MSRRTVVLLGLTGLLLGLAGVVVLQQVRGVAAWRATEARAAELRTAFEADTGARPVLWGEAKDGNAWVDYDRAVAALHRLGGADRRWHDWSAAEQAGNAAHAAALRDAWVDDGAEVLHALRAGAHRRTSKYPIDWDAVHGGPTINLLDARRIANLTMLAAQRAAAAGDAVEAVHLQLDALQYGRDLLRVPRLVDAWIGGAIVGTAVADRRLAQPLAGSLPRHVLHELQRGLELADSGLDPQGAFLRGEALLFARLVHASTRPEEVQKVWPGPGRAWRYGFSVDLMAAGHFASLCADAARLDTFSTRPWTEVQAEIDALTLRHQSSVNAFNVSSGVAAQVGWQTVQQAVAGLRLLRAAVGYRLGGELPEIADPFGEVIQHDIDEHVVRLWSALHGPHGNSLVLELPRTAAMPR